MIHPPFLFSSSSTLQHEASFTHTSRVCHLLLRLHWPYLPHFPGLIGSSYYRALVNLPQWQPLSAQHHLPHRQFDYPPPSSVNPKRAAAAIVRQGSMIGSSPRHRQMSPTGKHIMMDPMRASTGTVQLNAPSNEPREPHNSRQSHRRYPSDASYSGTYDPRSPLEAQPVSSTTYRHPDQTTKLRTEYAIRPRPRSNTASAADGYRSSLRLTAPPTVSPPPVSSRPSPIITSSYSRSISPWTADSDRYMVPSSSHSGRRRVYNVDYGSDTSRVTRPQRYHAEPTNRWRYPATGALRKGDDIDEYSAYSYTKPEEVFEKDSVDRLRRSRGQVHVHPRRRPLSMTGAEDFYPHLAPKDPRARGPPPSQRGFDKLDRERVRRSTYGAGESDRESTWSRRRSSHRPPMSLHHQDWDDGYYSSFYQDGYYDDGHRQHRRRSKYHHDDKEYRRSRRHDRAGHGHADPVPETVAGAGAPLGTAVLASGYEDSSYDLSSRGDWPTRPAPYPHDYRRHHSRSRRPSRRRARTDTEAYTSDEDLRDHPRQTSVRHRYSGSETSNSSKEPSQHLAVEAPRRRKVSRSRNRADSQAPEKDTTRKGSGSSQEEPKKPAENNPPKEPEPQPKGILKPPRDRFPEEPNPVREGVAPLKDAHKKGIPPDARWTKVDRRLVNPAALKAGNERFVVRPECVVVLRVLTEEEIQAYAVATQEIRGK